MKLQRPLAVGSLLLLGGLSTGYTELLGEVRKREGRP
jgi:hypothetical protein